MIMDNRQLNGRTLTLTLSLTRQGRGESPLPRRLGERIKVRGTGS